MRRCTFLFLTLFLAALSFSSALRTRCRPEDAQTLREIFNKPIGDCCRLLDSSCNMNTSWVEVLTIKNDDISGELSPSFGKLTHVDTIILVRLPNVRGPIPPEMAKLTNLTFLRIRSTNISGPVPLWLGQLKNLKGLDLSNNQLTGSIPPSIRAYPPLLEGLDLSWNRLTGSIPDSLGQLPLSGLGLSHNQLTGTVPSALGRLNLDQIDWNRNRLEGDPSHLFSNRAKSLTRLDLSRNLFAFDLTNVVFPVNLSYVDLSHNMIRGSISKDILNVKELYQFNVSYNRLCGKIPEGGALQTLSSWSFTHNSCLCGPPLSPSC